MKTYIVKAKNIVTKEFRMECVKAANEHDAGERWMEKNTKNALEACDWIVSVS